MTDTNNIKSQAKKAVIWSFISNIANHSIQFVIGIVLARLLSPSDYGITALPAIFLAVAQCFIDSGFSSALVRKPDLTDNDLSTAFYFNIGVGIFFYTILFFASPLIAEFYNVPILADILKFTALSTLFGPLTAVHHVIFSRNLDFKTTAKISLTSKITTGCVGIILAYLGYGVWALVFQGVASHLVNVILVWKYSKWRPHSKWSNESFKYLFGFGSKLLASSILDTLYRNINPIIIGKFYSPADLGIYNRGRTYAVLPHDQINGMILHVSFPLLSKLQEDEKKLNDYFRKMIRIIIFVLSPAELLLAALARPLVLILITDRWESCILLLQLMCFAVMLWPIQSLNMALFQVRNRTDLALKANVVVKILGLAIKAISLPLGLVAICIGNIVHAIVAISWMAYYAGKFSEFSIFKQFKEMSRPLALSVSMFLLVISINHFIESLILQVVIGGTIGLGYYICMAIFFKMSEWEEFKYMIHLKK